MTLTEAIAIAEDVALVDDVITMDDTDIALLADSPLVPCPACEGVGIGCETCGEEHPGAIELA